MSFRERPAPGVAAKASRSASGPAAPKPPDPVPRAPSWEEVYLGATPAEQAELLALAQRQGLLYGHQLPTPGNGTQFPHNRQLLSQLLVGHAAPLEPVHPGAV